MENISKGRYLLQNGKDVEMAMGHTGQIEVDKVGRLIFTDKNELVPIQVREGRYLFRMQDYKAGVSLAMIEQSQNYRHKVPVNTIILKENISRVWVN